LQVPGLPSEDSSSRTGTVSIEVGSGWAKLRGPALPQLGVIGKALPPWELLSECAACGLQLTPSSREQAVLGLLGKDAAAEQAMCIDVAGLWWVMQTGRTIPNRVEDMTITDITDLRIFSAWCSVPSVAFCGAPFTGSIRCLPMPALLMQHQLPDRIKPMEQGCRPGCGAGTLE
jgi:hypothetical protein